MTFCRYCERCGAGVEFSRAHDCKSPKVGAPKASACDKSSQDRATSTATAPSGKATAAAAVGPNNVRVEPDPLTPGSASRAATASWPAAHPLVPCLVSRRGRSVRMIL